MRSPGMVRDRSNYRLLFESGRDGVLLTSDDGSIVLEANPKACSLLQRSRRDLMRGEADFFDPSDARLKAAREEQRRTGRFEGHLRLLRRDGTSCEAEITVTGYQDGPGGEGRLVIVFRDTGEAREAEETYGESEVRASPSIRYAPDLVVLFEVDGRLRYASPSIEKVLGYKPEEMVGTIAIEMMHPDDAGDVVDAMIEVWDKPGINPPIEFRARHKDGSWRWLEAVANNLLDDPNVEGVVVNFRNVTERVKAEEEVRRLNETLERRVAERTMQLNALVAELTYNQQVLRESENRFRTTLELAAVGIAEVSPDGGYLWVNRKLSEIVGYEREEILGKTFQEITHPEDLEADLDHLRRMLRGEVDEYSTEKRYVRKDGSAVWAKLSVSLVRRPSGGPSYFIGVVENIDERKKAEFIRSSLTPRENQVLKLLAQGRSNPQIAKDLAVRAYPETSILEKMSWAQARCMNPR